jgi:uncharacterized protein YbjT (DUF2867 family)
MRECMAHVRLMQQPILVLGGTGKTGRRIAERLAARNVPTRVASRASRFEWHDATTWRPTLDGARAMYVAYHPDIAAPGAAELLREFAKVAVDRGVRRIVLLSGRGEPQAEKSEHAVHASGADLTVLRAAVFAQNFTEGAFADSVKHGVFSLPAKGTAGEPFIDIDDLADVAVATLLDDAHIGKTFELTGPRVVTLDEAARELGVRYTPATTGEFVNGLAEHVPAEEAAFLGELFTFLLDGHNAYVTDDVVRVLGRKARDFRDFVARHRST